MNDVLVVQRVTCEKIFEVRLTTPFEVIQEFGLVCSCGIYLYCATKLDIEIKKPCHCRESFLSDHSLLHPLSIIIMLLASSSMQLRS